MKRIVSTLAVAAGVLGTVLSGAGPASADTVDCSTGDWTRVHTSYVPTNVERPAIDGFSYNIAGSWTTEYEVCLDIPDNASKFAIEVRVFNNGSWSTITDDRPGDKVIHYTIPPNSLWQVYGTLTGPGSTFLYYTWNEKKTLT